MKLLKSISFSKDGKIVVQDTKSKKRRKFDSMNDALEFLVREKHEKRTSK